MTRNFKRGNILDLVEYFGHLGCKWKRKMYIFIDSKLNMLNSWSQSYRAMGPSPPQARGVVLCYKTVRGAKGPKKNYIFDKIDKNNDNNQVWDGVFYLKCTQKKIFDLNTCLFTQYTIYVFMFKKCLWVHIYRIYDLRWSNFKRENILYLVEYFGHLGCKWKRKMYIFIVPKPNQ